MKKSNLIQFSIIFTLFITYHLTYIYFNQTGTINSDTIWSYSFSRDIIEGVNLEEFAFPPFYYFFDILISFIPSLLEDHVLHAMIVSPVNIVIFILFFSLFYKLDFKDDYFKSVILLILSTLIVYFLFITLSLMLSMSFNAPIYPLLILKNYFFMQANHGLSAVAALVISYLYYFKQIPLQKKIILFFLVFLFSLSDFWFAVYFLPIVGILFLINPNQNLLKEIIYLTLSSIIALMFTYLNNEALNGYNDTLGQYTFLKDDGDFLNIIIGIVSTLLIMYILPFFCYLHLYYKNKLSNFIKSIFFASIVSTMFIIIVDFTFNNMRFCVFALPLNILLTFEVLKLYQIKNTKLFFISLFFLIFGLVQILTFNITDKMRNNVTHFDFKEEILCINEVNKIKNYSIFLSYWPSKIIFESLNRKINIVSTGWIYNPEWSRLFDNSNGFIIVKYEHYPEFVPKNLVNEIENGELPSTEFCNDKLILVENSKISYQK